MAHSTCLMDTKLNLFPQLQHPSRFFAGKFLKCSSLLSAPEEATNLAGCDQQPSGRPLHTLCVPNDCHLFHHQSSNWSRTITWWGLVLCLNLLEIPRIPSLPCRELGHFTQAESWTEEPFVKNMAQLFG